MLWIGHADPALTRPEPRHALPFRYVLQVIPIVELVRLGLGIIECDEKNTFRHDGLPGSTMLHQHRPVTFDDDPPKDTALAAVVVAVRPVHGRAVIDHQHVAAAPLVSVNDLRLNHAV